MMTDTKKRLIILTIIVKILIILTIYLAYNFLPFNNYLHDINFVYPENESITLKTAYKTWDGQHFIYLAENGYAPNSPSNSFYPLFPFLIWIYNNFTLHNSLISGLILSNIFSFIGILFFFEFIKKRFNEGIAYLSSLFLLVFPTSFYFSLIYAESLFFMLIMIFIYYLYENKLVPAFLAGVLLPLTKPQGSLIVLPLLVYLFFQNRQNIFQFKFNKNYFLILAIAIGFILHLLLMQWFTGNFLSSFEAEKLYVANATILNLLHPLEWLTRNFTEINLAIHNYTQSIIDRLFFGIYLFLLYLIYKKTDKTLFAYSIAMGLIPALSEGFLMSYLRILLLVFPIFLVLAIKYEKYKNEIVIISTMLQTLFLIMHSLNYWVG